MMSDTQLRGATQARGASVKVTFRVEPQKSEEVQEASTDNVLVLDSSVFRALQEAQGPLNIVGISTNVVVPKYRAPQDSEGSTPLQVTLVTTPRAANLNIMAKAAMKAVIGHLGAVGITAAEAVCYDTTLMDLRGVISNNINYYLERTADGSKRETSIPQWELWALPMSNITVHNIVMGNIAPYKSSSINGNLQIIADFLGVTVDDLKTPRA